MKFLIAASLLATAFSLPEVTIKELPASCSSYPGYDAFTNIAGPWTLKAVDTENTAIEGFGNINTFSYGSDPRYGPFLRWGFIQFPTRNDVAKTPLRCSSTLQAYVATSVNSAGAPEYVQWTPLVLSPYPYDAALMYKITGGIPVKIYEHYIGEEKQDGVFVGGYNTTAWGFTWQPPNQATLGQAFYYIRLLGADSGALGTNETRGYIKVDA